MVPVLKVVDVRPQVAFFLCHEVRGQPKSAVGILGVQEEFRAQLECFGLDCCRGWDPSRPSVDDSCRHMQHRAFSQPNCNIFAVPQIGQIIQTCPSVWGEVQPVAVVVHFPLRVVPLHSTDAWRIL